MEGVREEADVGVKENSTRRRVWEKKLKGGGCRERGWEKEGVGVKRKLASNIRGKTLVNVEES